MVTKSLISIMMVMAIFSTNSEAQKTSTGKKVLVVYFSRSGNTRAIANHIKEITGGDLFEIQVTKPYPAEYRACTDVAKKEKENQARPALKNKVENIAQYDTIFIGYPNWWGTMPMPILTFIESYDFSGKILIPFCTHGGGGEQNCFTDFIKHTDKYEHKKGFLTNGEKAKSSREEVEKWLHEIGIIK